LVFTGLFSLKKVHDIPLYHTPFHVFLFFWDVTETVPYNDDVKATMDGNGNVTSPNITSLKIKSSITASGAGTAKIKLNVGTGEVIVNVNVRKVDVSDSKLLLYHRAEVNGYNLDYTK